MGRVFAHGESHHQQHQQFGDERHGEHLDADGRAQLPLVDQHLGEDAEAGEGEDAGDREGPGEIESEAEVETRC